MRVLLVTSWDTPCGIFDHSRMLKASVEAADSGIEVVPSAPHLDARVAVDTDVIDLIHCNHHDALHASWTPERVFAYVQAGTPVLVTYHDTRARLADCPKLAQLANAASAIVVHEPVEGLEGPRVFYWRQGVPAAAQRPAFYSPLEGFAGWMDGTGYLYEKSFKAFPQQPVLGTFGFHFPWKNYDRLAQITGEDGWALVILSNNATEEDEARWRALNSSILVIRKFLPQDVAINYLAGCDATAFMYECSNTGTSAAIRYGIAARKPVIAFQGCRQFRDLQEQGFSANGLHWEVDWEGFRARLQWIYPMRVDPRMHALAERDSWKIAGQRYAKLYRALVDPSRPERQ